MCPCVCWSVCWGVCRRIVCRCHSLVALQSACSSFLCSLERACSSFLCVHVVCGCVWVAHPLLRLWHHPVRGLLGSKPSGVCCVQIVLVVIACTSESDWGGCVVWCVQSVVQLCFWETQPHAVCLSIVCSLTAAAAAGVVGCCGVACTQGLSTRAGGRRGNFFFGVETHMCARQPGVPGRRRFAALSAPTCTPLSFGAQWTCLCVSPAAAVVPCWRQQV